MTETIKTIKEIYLSDYSHRTAKIVFINGEFDRCEFSLNKSIYDFGDWAF